MHAFKVEPVESHDGHMWDVKEKRNCGWCQLMVCSCGRKELLLFTKPRKIKESAWHSGKIRRQAR